MTKPDDYLWDRSGPADPQVARLEAMLSPLRHDAPLDELRLRRPRRKLPWVAMGVVAAAAVVLLVWWRASTGSDAATCSGAGFAFSAKGGTVSCQGASVASGRLPIGGTLDTGAHEAELAIAEIGTAHLGAETLVRLDRTSADRHQLHLERGRMHAKVAAPPRIFAITTPSANVTDLGCEYTIEVDRSGAGTIEVLTGMVELETGSGTVVIAPAGTHARLLAGRRASLPLETTASAALVAAVADFERGSPDAVSRVLATATEGDALTVANLYSLVHTRAVLERLAVLSPPADESITVNGAFSDDKVFERWRQEVLAVRLAAISLPF